MIFFFFCLSPGRRDVSFVLSESLTVLISPLQSLCRRRAVGVISVTSDPPPHPPPRPMSTQLPTVELKARETEERLGEECLWLLLVFVLKSSFAKRRSINTVGLFFFLLVWLMTMFQWRQDTMFRGSSFLITDEERSEKENASSLLSSISCFRCSPRAGCFPLLRPLAPKHAFILTVLPLLFNNVAVHSPCPIACPVTFFFF